MRTRFFCIVAALSISGSACHRPPAATGYAGTWAMNLGTRSFIVLTIEENHGAYTGSWAHPKRFDLGMGKGGAFSHISTEIKRDTLAKMSVQGSHLHFDIPDPTAPSEPDEYDMTLKGADEALVQMVNAPIDPWPFARSQGGGVPAVATDWDAQRSYTLKEEPTVSNPEMRAIFDEDQRVRQDQMKLSEAQWVAISQGDTARRQRTSALLKADQLHTGEDFREAAFVFQHGDGPGDYLLAHTLAMVAVGKGDSSALWIGTATLDRYLHAVHQPQIYGTQFTREGNGPMSQEPYNRELISDPLRQALGVPSLAAQQEQLKSLQASGQD
jgi:hypothetical protein